MMKHLPPTSRSPRNRGFNLLEVLMAIAILGIGVISLAGVFYMAGNFQRATTNDIIAHHVNRDVKALLRARGISEVDLTPAYTQSTQVDETGYVVRLPYPTSFSTSPDGYNVAEWSLTDRVSPWHDLNPAYLTGTPEVRKRLQEDIEDVNTFWVPLLQDTDTTAGVHDWQVFVFVLKHDADKAYPRTSSPAYWANYHDGYHTDYSSGERYRLPGVHMITATQASSTNTIELSGSSMGEAPITSPRVGDQILGSNGVIYTILTVDGSDLTVDQTVPNTLTYVWYAEGAVGDPSPTQQIIKLGSEVVK